MEVKIIKDIKIWVLFNILKGRAHLLRIKHFLKPRDIVHNELCTNYQGITAFLGGFVKGMVLL